MMVVTIRSRAGGRPKVVSRNVRQLRDGGPDELVEQLADGLGPAGRALSLADIAVSPQPPALTGAQCRREQKVGAARCLVADGWLRGNDNIAGRDVIPRGGGVEGPRVGVEAAGAGLGRLPE